MSETSTTRQHRLALVLCLLLALALIGGTIGSWVYRSLRQQWVVAALSADPIYRASVSYAHEFDGDLEPAATSTPPGPAWLRDLLGIDFFGTVVWVVGDPQDNATLRQIGQLTSLRVVDLGRADHVDDKGIEQLGHLRELERVHLKSCPLTARGLAALASLPRLHTLLLFDCPEIDDAGVGEISKISGLNWLYFSGSKKVTTAGLAKLNRLAKLESLTLEIHPGATDAVLEQLQSLPLLRRLGLSYDHGGLTGGLRYLDGFVNLEEVCLLDEIELSDVDLAVLPKLPKLRRLVVDVTTRVSADGLKNLARLTNLRSLSLTKLSDADDAAIAEIAELPRLEKELILSGTDLEITDTGLESIGKMTGLHELWLASSPGITDAGLKHLERLESLTKLVLHADHLGQFSSEALQSLEDALPGCDIRYVEPHP